MLRIKNKNLFKKKVLLISALSALVVLSAVYILIYTSSMQNNSNDPSSEISKQEKKSTVNNNDIPVNNTGEELLIDQEESNQNTQNEQNQDSIDIKTKTEGSQLIIIANIPNPSDGNCKLNVIDTDSAEVISSQEADVLYQDIFSTCAGFTIDTSSVNAKKVKIEILTNNNSGELEVKL